MKAERFTTAEVPFITDGNRQILTGTQLVEEPWLADFVKAFPHCFEHEINRDYLVYYPDGDAPHPCMEQK